jgi:hypothetical protein
MSGYEDEAIKVALNAISKVPLPMVEGKTAPDILTQSITMLNLMAQEVANNDCMTREEKSVFHREWAQYVIRIYLPSYFSLTLLEAQGFS